ncbi:MAG: ATP-dependent 6-phosphofructokinase [Spirochaetaceae bacterium]|nr:MAG: ATP-dependent 6-phosphofructokinase [Spirochaetaceae bacterium]
MSTQYDFSVPTLGPAKVNSPIDYSNTTGDQVANFVDDNQRIIYDVSSSPEAGERSFTENELLEKAGPRQKIYFAPGHVHAGIVTCGGLCPGLNDVIRAITRCLWYRYGVHRISGIQFGYRGLLPEHGVPTLPLNPDVVDDIHRIGGTILGSSRGGGHRTEELVDTIERMNLNILFAIGGDGTQKGALAIAEEIERRWLKIAVIGIPKTIDNDLSFTEKSFGFETAVAQATHVVFGAHAEAHSAVNGIGLVKVMGRDAGFIASHTALASHEVNFVLIPEVPFELHGDNGFLTHLERRLARRNHAVIVVAEGAGQHLLDSPEASDASGNRQYADIGLFLKNRISEHFSEKDIEINLKYIDPSYIIRSAPAAPTDSVYCSRLGHNAVHAAMAGKTKILMGLVNNTFVHVPIQMAVASRSRVDPDSSLWRDVIESTHQPVRM